jgi:anaerobic selenocysteine-containing dehydrogenase
MLEEYYTLGIIGKVGIGTPHMDGNTRLCTATAAAAALKESFGSDGQPDSNLDIDETTASCMSATTSPIRTRCCTCASWTGSPGPGRPRSSVSTPARR